MATMARSRGAVELFQLKQGLAVTGNVDPHTWSKLREAPAALAGGLPAAARALLRRRGRHRRRDATTEAPARRWRGLLQGGRRVRPSNHARRRHLPRTERPRPPDLDSTDGGTGDSADGMGRAIDASAAVGSPSQITPHAQEVLQEAFLSELESRALPTRSTTDGEPVTEAVLYDANVKLLQISLNQVTRDTRQDPCLDRQSRAQPLSLRLPTIGPTRRPKPVWSLSDCFQFSFVLRRLWAQDDQSRWHLGAQTRRAVDEFQQMFGLPLGGDVAEQVKTVSMVLHAVALRTQSQRRRRRPSMKQWRCVGLVECVALLKNELWSAIHNDSALSCRRWWEAGLSNASPNFSESCTFILARDAQPSTCTRLCSVYGPRNGGR